MSPNVAYKVPETLIECTVPNSKDGELHDSQTATTRTVCFDATASGFTAVALSPTPSAAQISA